MSRPLALVLTGVVLLAVGVLTAIWGADHLVMLGCLSAGGSLVGVGVGTWLRGLGDR